MNHLREEGCDVFGDLAPQRLGGALPDAFGPDEHVAPSLSSARAISSATASAESLLSPASGGRGTRLVAASGSFSSTRLEWATRM
jgi:hypothetical protein